MGFLCGFQDLKDTTRYFIQLAFSSSIFKFSFFFFNFMGYLLACFSTEKTTSVNMERLKCEQQDVR